MPIYDTGGGGLELRRRPLTNRIIGKGSHGAAIGTIH